MNNLFKIVICSLVFFFDLKPMEACTAFQLKSNDGTYVYCRSMEFGIPLDSNLLIVPRGTEYTGTTPKNDSGIRWKTQFGYVGMNQSMAPTQVSDGMNEKGLVVGCLYLPEYTKYETVDPNRLNQTLGPWELAGFLLGTCSTVEEVKSILPNVLVAQVPLPGMGDFIIPLHFYICDHSGKVLIVEYINGKRFEHDDQLGILTNSPPFDWHLLNLGNFVNLSPINVPQLDLNHFDVRNIGQGSGLLGLPGDYTPPSRFVRAALFSQWATPQNNANSTVRLGVHVLNTFDIFEGVIRAKPDDANLKNLPPILAANKEGNSDSNATIKNNELTQWIILHDRTNLRTYFRSYDNLRLQMVDLKRIDFTQPGFKQVQMRKDFLVDDVTNDAKALSQK